jgi:hypothetical protein
MLTDEQFRWAEALAIERQHGADAPNWIAKRIGALALAGDDAGVTRLRVLACCLDQLRANKSPS